MLLNAGGGSAAQGEMADPCLVCLRPVLHKGWVSMGETWVYSPALGCSCSAVALWPVRPKARGMLV